LNGFIKDYGDATSQKRKPGIIASMLDTVLFRGISKSMTCKLAALSSVEDLWPTIETVILFQSRHTEVGIQGVGEAP